MRDEHEEKTTTSKPDLENLQHMVHKRTDCELNECGEAVMNLECF